MAPTNEIGASSNETKTFDQDKIVLTYSDVAWLSFDQKFSITTPNDIDAMMRNKGKRGNIKAK